MLSRDFTICDAIDFYAMNEISHVVIQSSYHNQSASGFLNRRSNRKNIDLGLMLMICSSFSISFQQLNQAVCFWFEGLFYQEKVSRLSTISTRHLGATKRPIRALP